MIVEIRKFLQWSGLDSHNKLVRGYIFTSDKLLAEKFLSQQGIIAQEFSTKWKICKALKLTTQAQANFYKQLAALLRAGIPLIQALHTLENTYENFIKKILYTLRMHIEIGNSFHSSLQQHPNYFDHLSCQLIHIAEQTGTLETMLEKIAIYHEKKKTLSDSVKQALLYPIIILSTAILVTIIMLVFVVPQFVEIFAEFNAPLPMLTRAVIQLSACIRHYAWIILFIIPSVIALLNYLKRSPRINLIFHTQSLSIPILQNLLRTTFSAKFAHALAIMLSAGLPIERALSLLEKINFNHKVRLDMKTLQKNISQGHALHISMQQSSLFTPLILQMVKVGEESGMLANMLLHVASVHDSEMEYFTKQITQLLEPLIIIILGVLIGSLVISMYLPIFKLGTVM